MSIMRTLYDVAERNDAPPEVMTWLWSTHNAPDRDERLRALRAELLDGWSE